MKLLGEFMVRQVMDNTVAIPVSSTAIKFSGMILLNEVSLVIWKCLEKGTELPLIVSALTDAFEVSPEEAEADTVEFLEKLKKMQLLEE